MFRLGFIFLVAATVWGVPAAAAVTNFVVAVVDGEVISRHDCEVAWRIGGQTAAPEELIDRLVDRRLLVAEGRRFGLADEVTARVDDVAVRARAHALEAAHTPVEQTALRRWLEEEAIIRAFERIRIDPFVRVEPKAKHDVYDAAPERYAGKPFYEVEEEISRDLHNQARRQRLAEVVAALRSRAHIRRPTHPLPLLLNEE